MNMQNKKFYTSIIIAACLIVLLLGTQRVNAAEEWQNKELVLPHRVRFLLRDFSNLDFRIEFDRESHSQKVNYAYEYLGKEKLEGEEKIKTKMSMGLTDQQPETIYAWYGVDFLPVLTEMDNQKLPGEMAFQFTDAILQPFNRMEEIEFTDFPDLDFDYLGKSEDFWQKDIPVHLLEVPSEELTDDLTGDFRVKLAEFDNSLAVVYYNYEGYDAEPVTIILEVDEVLLQ